MSGKHLSFLAVAVIVVIGAVLLFVPGQTGREALPEAGLVLPDLAGQVNDATGIEVRAAGDRVVATLRRDPASGEDVWSVDELGGYPADWGTVREVLAALARAEVIEPKTDNPAYYDRLGVQDVTEADASGLLLTVSLPDAPVAVILGDEAPARGGRYLRPAGEARSVLADFDADVPEDALGWADEDVVDIAPAEVAEVEIVHPDGERLRVSKVSADDADYTLDGGVPEGRELASSWSVNALGGLLAGVVMDGVRAADEIDWSDAIALRFVTFDGLVIEASLAGVDDAHWLKLSASAPWEPSDSASADTVDEGLEDAAQAADSATDDVAAEDSAEGEAVTADERASEINGRVAGWAYEIPAYKAEAMDKRLEDLLKPLEDGQGGS